jgi:hypothetical protein
MNTRASLRGALLLGLAALAGGGTVPAQQPEHSPPGTGHPQGAVHAQPPLPHSSQPTVRLHQSHYYPPHGTAVSAPPPSTVVVNHPSGHYYYSGGTWYAPRGASYVVVAAPVGVFVPVLPVYYTTLWVGGAPYYYANDTYYSWNPAQNGYQVVDPPNGADGAPDTQDPTPPPPPNDDLFVYPQHGQSDEQQASDRYECHKWAGLQSGFDPTQQGGQPSGEQGGGNPEDYQRAMKACLEGRGYSVR